MTRYFTGAKPRGDSSEFRSEPQNSPREAVEIAGVASRGGYSNVTIYAEREGRIVGVPFSDIDRMGKSSDLEFLFEIVQVFDKKFDAEVR
jgi:hypothetical protein